MLPFLPRTNEDFLSAQLCYLPNVEVPESITCVDCGEKAHLLSYAPEEGWQEGDVIAYRCRGCNDRWDMVLEPDQSVAPDADTAALFAEARARLADRDVTRNNGD